MLNIMITGVGGQGTVLAAKLLAQAAEARNWRVRTAETIGMAQRGGSVVSHVRLANQGESCIDAPLIARGEADLIIAFEPAEAVRCLGYLRPGGALVSATSSVQPVTAALSREAYSAEPFLDYLKQAVPGCLLVDDAALIEQIGSTQGAQRRTVGERHRYQRPRHYRRGASRRHARQRALAVYSAQRPRHRCRGRLHLRIRLPLT